MAKETEIIQTGGERNLTIDSPEWVITEILILGDKSVRATIKFTSDQGRVKREDAETYDVAVDVETMLRDVENEISQKITRE